MPQAGDDVGNAPRRQVAQARNGRLAAARFGCECNQLPRGVAALSIVAPADPRQGVDRGGDDLWSLVDGRDPLQNLGYVGVGPARQRVDGHQTRPCLGGPCELLEHDECLVLGQAAERGDGGAGDVVVG